MLTLIPEMTAAQVLDSLQAGAGTIRPKSVERVFKKMEIDQNMKPGRYVVDTTVPSIYVARMLAYGWQKRTHSPEDRLTDAGGFGSRSSGPQ